MLSFYHYCLQPDPKGTFPWRGCIAYSLCLPTFMTRVLFWKAEEGLPTSHFQLPTSDFRTIQKLFFPLLLGRLCSRRFFLSRLFHIRAVYTRENMPRLTIAAAYIRRESNTPYKWYKIYAHGLFNPRPAEAAAYPGRRVLGWAYPSRGLPWTWKCSYKCTQTLSAACWSRERLLRMLCFQLHSRPSRPRDARCSGGKMSFVYIYKVENGG